ncbi:NAD(P)H-binding protein [Streptosporangium soli]|nr:NAD(P)H-binding protein [Streptosporangium sp. KLBMP 9127]
MKITIIGASGGTGTQLVRLGLEQGHDVTAVVRDRGRLAVPDHPRLEVAVADPLDARALGPLVEGRDAVLSALSGVCADGATATVRAMHEYGVRRLLVVSAGGAHPGPGDDPFTRYILKPILCQVLRRPYADILRMEDIVRDSGLGWTIVLPPRLTDGSHTGRYRALAGRNILGALSMSRADLAGVMLTLVGEDRYLRQTATVG